MISEKSNILFGFLLSVAILFFGNYGFAEIIVLKSGETVEGKITEKTDKYVKVDFFGTALTYFLDDIETIDGLKPTSSATATATTTNTTTTTTAATVPPEEKEKPIVGGLKYALKGDYENAERKFKEADSLEKGSAEDVRVAQLVLEDLNAGKITKDYADKLFKARLYLMDTKLQESITELKEAIKMNPNNPHAYRALGQCYLLLKQYQQALDTYQKTISLDPNEPRSYFGLGTAYLGLDQKKQAKEALIKSRELFLNFALQTKYCQNKLTLINNLLKKLP
jgi:hypothetical protein